MGLCIVSAYRSFAIKKEPMPLGIGSLFMHGMGLEWLNTTSPIIYVDFSCLI